MKKTMLLLLTGLLLNGCAIKESTLSEQKTAEENYNRYVSEYQESCPYGDAVLVNRIEQQIAGENATSISVDCINYDPVSKYWVTWRGELYGDKLVQKWQIKKYKAYNANGELQIKNDTITILDNK